MATYAIATTPDQEAALAFAVDAANAGRSDPLTSAQYLQMVIDSAIDSYRRQMADAEARAVQESYLSQDDQTKAQVRQLLGLA